MRRNILLIILFCFTFGKTYGNEPLYEIKAYIGTYFDCCVSDGKSYPSICSGIIIDCDSTELVTDNEVSFYQSLFKNAKYIQDGELFYAEAYNIIYPDTSERYNHYELDQEFNMLFNDLCLKHEKEVRFRLKSGKNVEIRFCKVKGIFVSVLDSDLAKNFTTSLDVHESLMPPIDSVNIPIAVFQCIESQHTFYESSPE